MANQRFSIGWGRFLGFFGYHHILMLIIVIAIVLLSLLLAGCSSSSPAIPNIFLISFYYQHYTPTFDTSQVDPGVVSAISNIVGSAMLEVRVGYFGICINPDGGSFLCSNNATSLAGQVTIEHDPLNLIWVASTFKDSIVFPYLLIVAIVFAFVCFILLATFPGWHAETDSRTGSDVDVKPFPSRAVSQVALALIFIASIFVLVSVLWQHTASVAAAQIARDLGNGSVRSGVGTAAMILGWFGFGLLVVVTIGILCNVLFDIFRWRFGGGKQPRKWCWLQLRADSDDDDDEHDDDAAEHADAKHGDEEKLDRHSAKKLAKLNARAAKTDRAHARALHLQLAASAIKAAKKEASRDAGNANVKRAAGDAWARALEGTDERGRRLLDEYAEARVQEAETKKKKGKASKRVGEDTVRGAPEPTMGGLGAALRGVGAFNWP